MNLPAKSSFWSVVIGGIEEWGEYNCDSSEEMLTTAFATSCIVAEDVITVNINIKFITLFPRFLNQPRANVILAHVINQVFKLGEIGGFVHKNIAICVLWATPEALGILGIDVGKMFLMFVVVVVAHKFMGL